MATKDLRQRIEAVERKLGSTQPRRRRRHARPSLAAEIKELERNISAMSYMDGDIDDVEDFGEVDVVEPGMDDEMEESYMDDEQDMAWMDDDDYDDEVDLEVVDGEFEDEDYDDEAEIDVMEDGMGEEDDMEWMEEEVGCGRMSSRRDRRASLRSPGVEDEITQDYLDEMVEETKSTVQTTGDSMLAVAPTEYVATLKRASARLDKVATYLERQGRVNLAARIDKIADAVDARAKKASRRA